MSYTMLNGMRALIEASMPDASPEDVEKASRRALGAACAVMTAGTSVLDEAQAIEWIEKNARRAGMSNSRYCMSVDLPQNTLSRLLSGNLSLFPETARKFGLMAKTTYRIIK
jgi:hypothetical protein